MQAVSGLLNGLCRIVFGFIRIKPIGQTSQLKSNPPTRFISPSYIGKHEQQSTTTNCLLK